MPVESYSLYFVRHKQGGVLLSDGNESYWFPKSQIEVDGVSHESDFENLVRGEKYDTYIPDWLAKDKGLL